MYRTPQALIRRTSPRARIALIPVVIFAFAFPGAASADKGGKPRRDTTAPNVAIASPLPGGALSGTVTVFGSASDNVQVAKVEVAVDGTYRLAQASSAWSAALDTTAYVGGSHTISARATDSSGNAAVTSVTVSFDNAAPDTTAPTVAVAAPASGVTVSGTATVSGSAFDDLQLARVEIGVDGGVHRLASGTAAGASRSTRLRS